MVNSPSTTLSSPIAIDALSIPVVELGVFPAAPNEATLGTGIDAETIIYTAKSAASGAGTLTTVASPNGRGFEGTAKAWDAGTQIGRNFTDYDMRALQSDIGEAAPLADPTFTGTPRAPKATPGTTDTTQIATTSFVQSAIKVRKKRIVLDPYNAIYPAVSPEFDQTPHGAGIPVPGALFPYNTPLLELYWFSYMDLTDWDGGQLTFEAEIESDTAGDSNQVDLVLYAERKDVGDSWDTSAAQAVFTPTIAMMTAARTRVKSIASTPQTIPGAGDVLIFKLNRATDTFAHEIKFIKIFAWYSVI